MWPRRSKAARISATAREIAGDRRQRSALAHVRDVGGGMGLEVGGGLDHVGGADHPPDPPTRHGVGLGDAVEHDALVLQLGDELGHGGEPVLAVGEVLVDLVGDDPDAAVDRPATDGLDLLHWVHRAGRVAGRHEQQCLRAVGHRRVELIDRDPKAGGLVGADHDRYAARQGDRLGVGGPVRRRQEHLVAGIEQCGEGVVDGVLAPVGDEHLAGLHIEAGVAQRLDRDGLLQLGEAAGRRVLVVPRVASGLHRCLHDVGRGREVGLSGAEADDRFAGGLERLGLGVDRERGGLGDAGHALG